jgi:histidinol-phosphate aminotransferase
MIPLRRNIVEMAAYVPGFQPEDEAAYIKLNTNENPYPPSPQVIEAILAETGAELRKYPDASSRAARAEAAQLYGFDPDWIIMANGSDEVLNNLIRAFAAEGDELAYAHPSYSYYETLAAVQGARVKRFGLTASWELSDFPGRYPGKLFFLTNPNAPFGVAHPLPFVEELAQRLDGVLVVDEAYVDFAAENALELVRKYDNVAVTRTL